jgi:DNA-binding MarR family transcriptional regulator
VSRRPHLDFESYLPYLVNRVGTALAVDFGRSALARPQLSIADWRLLAVLADRDGQRQIDLAGRTSIDASTLSRAISRLVKRGLVTRARSSTNSREVVVSLTAKGALLVTQLIPLAIAAERTAIAGVSPRDLAIVRRSLKRMYENLVATARR